MRIFITQKWLLELLLGSIAYVLCFPPWNCPIFSPLVLFFFLGSIQKLASSRQALAAALIFSSLIAVGGFHWIVFTVQNFGGLPLPVALCFLLAFCLVAAPQAYPFFYLCFRFRSYINRLPFWWQALFASALYVALEYLARFVKIFPENLGNTLIASLSLAQNASWGGASILSFFPLLLGAFGYFAWRLRSRLAYGALFGACLFVMTAFIWGNARLNDLERNTKTETIRFSLIQANIGDIDKVVSEAGDAEAIRRIIDKYLLQSAAAAKEGSDLLVWPETAYPITFPTDREVKHSASSLHYAEQMRSGLKKIGLPILFGGYERKNGADFNSIILLGADTEWQTSYRKVMLLIFGEYMPLSDFFPGLKKLNPQMGDFGRGPGPIPLVWNRPGKTPIQIGANICYEAIMPDYMRALAMRGAQVFVNATNDSWFGLNAEPWQHLQLAQLRAIENRIPFVRATNTGFSTALSFTGRTLAVGPLFKEANLTIPVAIASEPIASFYREHGEIFALLCLIFSALSLLSAVMGKKP